MDWSFLDCCSCKWIHTEKNTMHLTGKIFASTYDISKQSLQAYKITSHDLLPYDTSHQLGFIHIVLLMSWTYQSLIWFQSLYKLLRLWYWFIRNVSVLPAIWSAPNEAPTACVRWGPLGIMTAYIKGASVERLQGKMRLETDSPHRLVVCGHRNL